MKGRALELRGLVNSFSRTRLSFLVSALPYWKNYLQVTTGTFGRVFLQGVYFLGLVNALSLADMGRFSACTAVGILLGTIPGPAVISLGFRSIIRKPTLMGAYLTLHYCVLACSVPLIFATCFVLQRTLLAETTGLGSLLLIVYAEAIFWRYVEGMNQMNTGQARYTKAATLLILASSCRTFGALGMALFGNMRFETWALVYFLANAAAASVAFLLRPQCRLRFHHLWRLAKVRARQISLMCSSILAGSAQGELEKLVLLFATNESNLGLYTVAMRTIDFTTLALRPGMILLSRKVIMDQNRAGILKFATKIEFTMAAFSSGIFAVLIAVLGVRPTLLGSNVASALPLLSFMVAVPALKSCLDLQSDFLFAFNHLRAMALLLWCLVLLRSTGLYVTVLGEPGLSQWGLHLNLLWLGLYAVSATTVYSTIRSAPSRP